MANRDHTNPDPLRQRAESFQRPKPVYRPSVYELVAAALIWAIVGVAIVVIIGCSPARAGDWMPREFQGDWCVANANDDKVAEYRRGRCSDPNSDGVLKITRGGFKEVESGCDLRRVIAAHRGLWVGAFKCEGEGATWTVTYALSINRAGRLVMKTEWRSEDTEDLSSSPYWGDGQTAKERGKR